MGQLRLATHSRQGVRDITILTSSLCIARNLSERAIGSMLLSQPFRVIVEDTYTVPMSVAGTLRDPGYLLD